MTHRACGAALAENGVCTWRVWSPRATSMTLVLLDEQGRESRHAMSRDGESFEQALEGIAEGQRYLFQVGDGPLRPDPASRCQPDGVHAASAVCRVEAFDWTDASWRGVPLPDLVIYELHVGTFTEEGTFDAVIPRLDALRTLGVTAIEIMPVAQFPGRRNWGYDGTYWYAVQASYGGPRGLQRLVDACHAHGLGVILDVVYNHLGPEGNYLAEFGPYFTDKHHTPWGKAVNYDDADCGPVREFVLDNVRQWVRDFHVDGLRLDAVHAIYDDGPSHILKEIKDAARRALAQPRRPVHVIAEVHRNAVGLLLPPSQGGCGLDGIWNDDFHHCVHTLLTGESNGYYAPFNDPPRQLARVFNEAYALNADAPEDEGTDVTAIEGTARFVAPVDGIGGEHFVVNIQTHDQVGNRALGERLSGLVSLPEQRLAASLLLLSPYVPMLFMGEEYAEPRAFPFFCDFGDPHLQEAVRKGRQEEFADFAWTGAIPDPQDEATFRGAVLSWNWPDGSPHAGMRLLYGDLLALWRKHPALRDRTQRAAEIVETEEGVTILRVARGDPQRPDDVLDACFNWNKAEARMPERIEGELLLSSEAARYGGARTSAALEGTLLPWECAVLSRL